MVIEDYYFEAQLSIYHTKMINWRLKNQLKSFFK